MSVKNPTERDERMIEKVIAQAQLAINSHQVGVAALLALGDEIIAIAHNEFKETGDQLAHAEMVVLRKAADNLAQMSHEKKDQVTLYSTLEPCLMCLFAASFVGIKRIVYAALAEDAKREEQIVKDMTAETINPYLTRGEIELVPGVKREQGKKLLERMNQTR